MAIELGMAKHRHNSLRNKAQYTKQFAISRTVALIRHPLFIFLTLVGNAFVLAGATGFYMLEEGENPRLGSFLDAIWWSVQTVTTVGYGDISPITAAGKITGMFLMLFGTALFSAYTALFATILLEPEIEELEEEVREMGK